MMTTVDLLVDIPDDKGIHVKSAGVKGEKYVYKYTSYFRNNNGEPRNTAKAIGKFDPISGRMIPNKYYYDLYQASPPLGDILIWDYGYTYLVRKACYDTGLLECLKEIFGDRAWDIIVMAAYIIREGNAMDGLDDWQIRNYFPNVDRLITSQTSSKIFSSISHRQREEFFRLWIAKSLGDGCVCYDVTSVSSYAQEMTSVERGYNRDGDDLSQYNLGMFCEEITKVPLYYNRYNGSLTDKVNLSYVLENAKDVGIKRVKMVVDGGFWSPECFKNLNHLCEAFTVGMPSYLKEAENLIARCSKGIERFSNELPNHRHIYCVPVSTVIHSVKGRVLVYYDSSTYISQCDDLSGTIARLSAELSSLKLYPKNKTKRFTPYFTLSQHDSDKGFDYSVDNEKIEKLRSKKGYFLIFTTDDKATPENILSYYRSKDADEKIFKQIKVDIDGSRIHTHSEATSDGKTFVTFIACAIRAYILEKLSQYLNEKSISLKKVFNQLSDITIMTGQSEFRLSKALTKKQKQILSVFDTAEDIVRQIKQEPCRR
jgi:transposase